ncbi:hypothetical protein [Spiroplasma endosymbiont of Virgichneumon dumeticola]|uniref:hypothetical protein n=1 Tax=Spiroplasma endosymbiont of Virgichneumon dumeticola TaxID=3139323 RepID=UPI0035C8E24B
MNDIEESLLDTNNATSCLSTSTVRKLSYVTYTVGTGLIVYGVGFCIYGLIENKDDENKKTFDDSSLKVFLSGAATIVIGKVLEVSAKFCDNSNSIENRLDQPLPNEDATSENSFEIIENNEILSPFRHTSRNDSPTPYESLNFPDELIRAIIIQSELSTREENSYEITKNNERNTNRNETPPPTYNEAIKNNSNNESNFPGIIIHSATTEAYKQSL